VVFRRRYPGGKNLVVAEDVDRGFRRSYRGVDVQFVNLERLVGSLTATNRFSG